jgi:hypothetical protein
LRRAHYGGQQGQDALMTTDKATLRQRAQTLQARLEAINISWMKLNKELEMAPDDACSQKQYKRLFMLEPKAIESRIKEMYNRPGSVLQRAILKGKSLS